MRVATWSAMALIAIGVLMTIAGYLELPETVVAFGSLGIAMAAAIGLVAGGARPEARPGQQ